ncbi:MAG: monovalent cation/H+ antiporter complex subunit F [Candidatus Binatia bacterium]
MITHLALWNLVLPMLSLAAVLTTLRLLRGPSLPDRVVALDLLAVIAIAILAAFAVAVDQPVFLDIILALGLLAFLGTVAFATYIERRDVDG